MNPIAYLSAIDGFHGEISRIWLATGWTLLHFMWLGTAMGAAAWLLRRVLRPLGPQVCYVALLIILLGMAGGAFRLGVWVFERMPAPLSVDLAIPTAQAVAIEQPSVIPQRTTPAPAPPVITPADALRQEGLKWLGQAAHFAPWLWLIGSPGTLLFLVLGLAGAGRLRRQSRLLVTGEIADAARRLATAMRVSRHVTVAVCDRVVAPMLLGILRPLIVLPPAVLAGHSATQIEMILIHELAHVRRFDNLVNLVQRVIEALLFFHPAVWLVSRWVRLEREHCCDAVVLAHTGDPQTYAETLAALAIPGLSPAHAAAAMANHQLVTRIRQILNIEERSMTVSGKMLSFIGSLVVVTGLIVAAYAQSRPPEPAPDAKADVAKPQANSVDQFVLDKLLAQSALADKDVDDATFFRRRMLDLTGTLPTPDELKKFLDEKSPQKRKKLVDTLLASPKHNRDYLKYATDILLAQQALGQSNLTNQDTVTAKDKALLYDVLTTADGRLVASASAAKRPYSAEQLIGPPDSTMGSSCQSAWCALSADDQEEWLELEYAEPVHAVAVLVYENACPGAVSQLQVHSADQAGLSFTWADRDPTAKTLTHGVSVIPLATQMKTKRIKVTLDSKNTPGWNEIDAVGLLDQQGKVHWTASAKASSTYADMRASTEATRHLGITLNQGVVKHYPMIGGAVRQGDVLVALSDALPKAATCYVILQQDNGQDRVVRYTLAGNEAVLDVLAKVAPAERDNRRVWILRPGVGDNAIDQILRINREAVRQGKTETNFQVQPGDRIFVSGPEAKPDPKSDGAVRRGLQSLSQQQQTPQDALVGWITGSTQRQAVQEEYEKAVAAERVARAERQRLTAAAERTKAERAHAEAAAQTELLMKSAKSAHNRRLAARQQVEAVQAAHEAGKATFDFYLDAQRRLTDAEREYQQALEQQHAAQLALAKDREAAEVARIDAEAKAKETAAQLEAVNKRVLEDLNRKVKSTNSTPTTPQPLQPGKPPAKSDRPPAESTQLQTERIDLLHGWIGFAREAEAGKPANETARVTIKALLGQSATAAFSGVKQFDRVTVDAEEVAFASTAKPNEVIVCGKRLGKAQVRAHDADGKLYIVDIEFVEPQPPKPGGATP